MNDHSYYFLRSKVASEEKLRALQGKEAELQQLRQSLRERDRLIEKINSAVLESEEKNKVSQGKGTIKSYMVLPTKGTPSILLQV